MLDTETTGLSPKDGDKMVEIGAIELVDREVQPHRVFHHYINPQRSIPQKVVRIHGIDDAKVQDAPVFADIAEDFLAFIQGAVLVIHNAAFDLEFIMSELFALGMPNLEDVLVIDTLDLARELYPGQRNTLDALCDRFGVERGHRTLHGALLDSELLAEVYLHLTGGKQFSLGMDVAPRPASAFVKLPQQLRTHHEVVETNAMMRRPIAPLPNVDHDAHAEMMLRIHDESGGQAIWLLPRMDEDATSLNEQDHNQALDHYVAV